MKNKNFNDTDIDSIDILNVIRKGKLIIGASIIITLAATLFATKVFIKPIYETSAKILMREEKLNPKDDFPTYETGWQFANAHAEIMKSKSVINGALEKIDFADEEFKGIDRRSLQISDLQKSLDIKLLESTNVLELTIEQEHPVLASRLLNAIAETYIEDRVRLKSETVKRVISSLEKEIEFAKQDFVDAEEELNEIADKEHLFMISGTDMVFDLQKFADVDMRLTSVNADIEMLDTKIASIKDWMAKDDAENLDFKFVADSNVMQNLKGQISLAEIKLDVLMGEFSINHPDVQAAQVAISKLKMDFSKERTNIVKAEVRSLETEKKSLLRKKEAFLVAREEQKNRLNKVIQNQPQLARINRDIDMKRAIYSDLIKNLGELKVLEQRTSMLPDAEIIEFADVPDAPTKPSLLKNLLLGLLAGLIIGFGMALVSSASSNGEVSPKYDYGKGVERRASKRSKTSNYITCTVVGEKKRYDCLGKDIGRSGMKIITSKKLQRNNILEFEIHRDKMKPIVGNGVVVWTAPVVVDGGKSEYAAGVKFYDLELDIKNNMA